MTDLAYVQHLTREVTRLQTQLKQLLRHHLQVMTMLTHSVGGQLRLTAEDFTQVPPRTVLEVLKDPATGDTVFRTRVPEPTGEPTP